jgi:hypothetical protein
VFAFSLSYNEWVADNREWSLPIPICIQADDPAFGQVRRGER